MTLPRTIYDWTITPPHARALLLLLIVGAIAAGFSTAGRVWFRRSVPVDETNVAAAREYLDPNTATAGSLQRLPGVGSTRAEAIVQYRRAHPGAFRTADDLTSVYGLGEGTVRKISPYLTLPCGK